MNGINQLNKTRSKSSNDHNKENIDRKVVALQKHGDRPTTGRNPFASLQENADVKRSEVIANKTEQQPKRKLLRKSNLIKKLSHRSQQTIWRNCLYEDEYIEDNIKVLQHNEIEELIPLNLLQKCSTYRILMVNWLVHVHDVAGLLDTTLFTSVKNFDKILTIFQLPSSKYSLAAILSFWITAKSCDRGISISTIIKICKGHCTISEINAAERKILTRLNFKLIKVEPYTILYYYIKQQNLENNKLVIDSALFILHCTLLFCEYSATKLTLLAAQVLYMTLLKFKIDGRSFVNYVDQNLIDKETFDFMVRQLSRQIKEILNVRASCEHIIGKFSKTEYSSIARKFIDA